MNSYKAEEEVDKSMEADVEDEELADKYVNIMKRGWDL